MSIPRDVWMADDDSGCLECGQLRFRESAIAGVCIGCATASYDDDWSSDYAEPYVEDDWSSAIL